MYKLLIPFVAVGLSACGGGGEATFVDTENVITNTPTGVALTGSGSSLSQTGSGNFTISSSSSSFSLTRTDNKAANAFPSQRTYQLVVNGTTYNLNSFNQATGAYTGTSGNESVSLFLNENSSVASIINPQVTNNATGQKSTYYGIMGATLSPAAALTGSATYTGDAANNNGTVGEISIDNRSGGSDDTSASNVTLNVNFGAAAGNQITGSFQVTDGAGDGRGGVEIDTGGSAISIPVTNGTINGNAFTANIDLTPLQGLTAGVSTLSSNALLEGNFFGANAERAAAIGLSPGQSSATSGNDIAVYTRVIAKK